MKECIYCDSDDIMHCDDMKFKKKLNCGRFITLKSLGWKCNNCDGTWCTGSDLYEHDNAIRRLKVKILNMERAIGLLVIVGMFTLFYWSTMITWNDIESKFGPNVIYMDKSDEHNRSRKTTKD